MAQVINIQGTTPVEDPEYRYKMPAILGKVEGRGNGIKTAIPNMTQVALALHRDPGEVTKFFGCELGALTSWSPDTERSIVNGAHTTQDLQSKLFTYIEEFVLCPNCRLPETNYSIKNGCIYHKCGACGAKEMVNMQHKLTTFILAQHKKNKKDKDKKDKKDKKKRDKDADAPADDEGKREKKKKDKKDKDKKKKKKKDKKDKADLEEEGEDEEAPDGAAAEDRAAAEGEDGEGGEEQDEEGEREEEEEDQEEEEEDGAPSTLDNLAQEEMSAMEAGVAHLRAFLAAETDPSPEAVYERVSSHQVASMMPLSSCAYIVVQVFFDENIIKNGQVVRRAPVLARLVASDANKFMARHLLGAFEEFFCKDHPTKSNLFPLVLKQLYDQDVLDEDVILDWARAGVTHQFSPTSVAAPEINALRAAADPFIDWLKEADEEEEEEEEGA